MEEILAFVGEHILDFFLGIGVVVTTFLNKPKTAAKLQKIKEKKLTKLEREQSTLFEKLKRNAKAQDELNKE